MKFLDLFSGIGGFRLGLERNGFEPVGYVEIDKFARQSYEAMYDTKDEWTAEDITAVTDEEWRQFNGTVDLIAGGFPCQSFSIAGKRQGFLDETKGTLFFEIARAAQQIKPQYLFLENVKGLLNHDQGRTFRTIISTLDELGYDTEWRVLNSKDFGVPQNRERVYIIGCLRGTSGREVLPIFGENGEVNPATINDLLPVNNPRRGRRGAVLGIDGVSPTLEATDFKTPKQVLINPAKVNQVGNISDSSSFGGNPQVGRVYGADRLSPTLNTMQGGGLELKVVIPVLTPDRVNKRQNGRRFKNSGEPFFTLTAQDRHGVLIEEEPKVKVREATKKGYDVATVGDTINVSNPNSQTRRGRVGHSVANTLVTGSEQATLTNEMRIRKLTPRECWRLQAFPDELFDKAQSAGLSDSQLYKQAGNSVTVTVIEYIGGLIKQLED